MKRKLIFFIFSFLFIVSTAVLVQSSTGSCAAKKTKINIKKLTITKNDSYTLRVYNMKKRQTVRFTSDDETIVAVEEGSRRSRSASVTGVNVGTATVRASVYSRKGKLVCTFKTNVKVTPFAISIKFTNRKVKLNVSDTMKLSVIIKPNTSQEIPLFESSDSDIVTVNSRGVITAMSSGEAVISATLLSSGQKVQCRVTCLPAEDDTNVPLDSQSGPSFR